MIFLASSQHTHGPVDGSLYATILKSPKSLQTSPVKPLRTSTQSLISPPAEFSSNHVKYSIDTPDSSKFHTLSTSTPQVHTYGKSVDAGHYEDIKAIQEQQRSARNTPTPSVVSYSSRHSIQQSSQRAQPVNNGQYNGYDGNGYATVGQGSQQGAQGSSQVGGEQREFVRSPLTLSMDSGISSSGVVNRGGRGVQGGASSVSPVSFPSQASPQGKFIYAQSINQNVKLQVCAQWKDKTNGNKLNLDQKTTTKMNHFNLASVLAGGHILCRSLLHRGGDT